MNTHRLFAGTGLALIMLQGQAFAQIDTTDEIIVTATKRAQTLQEIPVAVSVVGASEIERAEIQDLRDLQSLVPSLQINQLQSSANTNFIIRGFGNGANNAGIEPSVGVFVDGVYRSRSASQISDLPNLQRVEVLRGPQSTLFGKNASAGVISIVTQKPQFETQGSVEASYGNFNAFRVKGDVTAPLSETVAFSLSGNFNSRDGYAEDLATGNEINELNRWGVRGQLFFEPSDNLEFRLIADYDEIDEVCCVAANLINGPTGGAVQGSGGQINGEDPFSYDVFGNFDSINEVKNSGISLQADYEIEDFATLTSITSYRTSDLVQNADSDFTSADLIGNNFNDTQIDTFTQEVRLTSNSTDSRFDWMIGGYYFDESVEIANDFRYGDDYRTYAEFLSGGPAALAGTEAFLGVTPGTLGASGQGLSEEFGQDNTAWSIFGNLDFHLSDRLTATIGLNYTEDEKQAYGRQTNTDVLSGLDLTQVGYTAALAGILGTVPGVDIANPATVGAFIQGNPQLYAQFQQGALAAAGDPAQNPFAALAPFQFLPPFLNFPNAVEDGFSNDDATTYAFRLAYDVSDNLNFYGSYATGFKATSWNLSRDSRPFSTDFTQSSAIVDPFTQQVVAPAVSSPITDAGLSVSNLTEGTSFAGPEDSEVFEIGLKGSFDRFAFNLTLFDQTIEGFQSNVFTGTGFVLVNAGEQSTKGVEFDANWNPIDALTLSFAGTYLDPVYDSFPDSASGDLSGQTPSGIPELSTSIGFNYDFTIRNWDSYIRADWQHTSDTDFFDDPGDNALIAPGNYTRGQDLVNASVGILTSNDLGVSLWARNLFDDQYITTAFPSVAQAGSISGYPSQPRTYGVTARKKF